MDAVDAMDGVDPLVIITYCHLFVTVCALLGVIYGAVFLLKESKALYTKMIFWAVVCAFISRLFMQAMLFYYQAYSTNIGMGTVGLFGSLFFILSANFGQINRLADDGSPRCIKARIIALIGPLLLIGGYIAFYIVGSAVWVDELNDAEYFNLTAIELGIMTLILLPCVYYNLKHAIIYDVKGGIVHSLRAYNIMALLYELLLYMEFVTTRLEEVELVYVSMILQGIVLLLILPLLRRGMKKTQRIAKE